MSLTKKEKQAIKKYKSKMMTVGKLKKMLEQYPDEMLVGGCGHFGEYLTCDDYDVSTCKVFFTPDGRWRNTKRELDQTILNIHIEDAGPDPD